MVVGDLTDSVVMGLSADKRIEQVGKTGIEETE